ncbi:hypothetical protein FF1_044860 [Malus domestica]
MVGLEACEMRNFFCCAKLVVSSALARHESRGLHYTIDFPDLEESKRLPTVIRPSSSVRSSWSSRQLHKLPLVSSFSFPSGTVLARIEASEIRAASVKAAPGCTILSKY